MQKRQTLLVSALILLILGCATAALLVWKRQQATVQLAAAIPEIPDLSRWPDSFSREVQDATTKARSGSDPVASLGRLACLYLGNSYVVEAKLPLATLCRLDPSNAQWRYLLADAHMRLGDTNAAEAGFEATTKLDPNYAMAWIRLGFLRSERGVVSEAHHCYVSATKVDPTGLLPAYLLLAFESINGGGITARQRVEEFSRRHPGFKEPHELLAQLYSTAGDETSAAKERRLAAAATQQLPNNDPWLEGLSQYCFDADRLRTLSAAAFTQQKYEASVNLLKRAVQIAPKDPLMRDALYSIYESIGRPDDALVTLQQAVVEFPDDPNLRVQLSRLLCSLQRPSDAVAAIQPAVQRWPENAKLRAALGFALSNAGKDQQAVAELREAIRLDSTMVEERFNLGVGLLKLGQTDAARAEAKKALEMRPDYTEALALLAVLALDDADLAAAEPPVQRLHALQPNDPKSQSLFCSLQLLKGVEAERAGNPVEAEKAYRAGLSVNPKFGRLLRAQGMLALRRGKLSDAVENLRVYIQIKPDDTEAYLMLGETLLQAGQGDAARTVLRQGLDLAQKQGNNPAEVEAFRKALQQQ